jgi:hypothetical protein
MEFSEPLRTRPLSRGVGLSSHRVGWCWYPQPRSVDESWRWRDDAFLLAEKEETP